MHNFVGFSQIQSHIVGSVLNINYGLWPCKPGSIAVIQIHIQILQKTQDLAALDFKLLYIYMPF